MYHTETSGYLKISLSRFQRSLMAQLRLGLLPLAIETYHTTEYQLKTGFANYAKMKRLRMKSTFSAVVNILTTSLYYFLPNWLKRETIFLICQIMKNLCV